MAYRDLESLQRYVLIAQEARRVEGYGREARRWSLQVPAPPDAGALTSIGVQLTFEKIYQDSGC